MNITYQRNLHKSYMCIETTEDSIEPHELMLLQKYKVPQLLEVQTVIQDGRTQYWFEITGKQQLADYLGEKPVSAEMLRKVLFCLEQVCAKMPEFLLKEDRLSLQKELLYVDLAEETIYFTYLPFENHSFPEKFQIWMAEILKEIDHQEPECVELAYQIYEAAISENISIHQLLKEVIKNSTLTSETPIFDAVRKDRNEELLPQDLYKESEQELRQEEESHKKTIRAFLESVISEKIQEIQQEIKDYFQSKIPSSPRKYLQTEKLQKIKEKTALSKEKSKETLKEREKKRFREKRTQKESNEKKRWKEKSQQIKPEEATYDTQKLYEIKNMVEGKLIYQGENHCKDILIQGVEFFIGRDSKQADADIKTESVSRLHARVLKKEGEYYIEDLNSTNGTYLNGKLLEYHKSKKLNKNDVIQFGAEAYVFF